MDSNPTIWHSTPPTITATTVAWQPAPTFRSTSNILISCLSTLFICVWSALHVDIPMPGTKWWQWRHHRSNLGWVFVGLFCPELLFLIAFTQFKMALLLTIKAHECLLVADDVKEGERARRPQLPRSYRVLKKVLGLTDKPLRRGWPDDKDTSTESSRGSDPGESKSEAVSPPIPPSSHVPQSTPLPTPPSLHAPSPVSPAEPYPAPDSSQPPISSPETVRAPTPVPPVEASIGANIPVGRQHRWTLAHGFYAAMGGFVLQDPYVTRSSHRYLPAWQVNGVLTPAGVLALMRLEPSLIPDIAYEDIVSFGKADAIAKALLILQVSWFLITCILRRAQGLPLCLLEITTIAHAACTLLTYLLWWAKPKDVEHQIVIVGEDARLLGAWMSMASGAFRNLLGGFLGVRFASELYSKPDTDYFECGDGRVSYWQRKRVPARRLKMKFIFGETTVPWYWDQASEQPSDEVNANQERWTLAYRAMQKYPDTLPADSELDGVRYVTPTPSLQAYTNAVGYDGADFPSRHFFVVTLLMGAVYGLPHLIGFTVTFASATERTLWSVATVLVATLGLVLFATLWILSLPFKLWDKRQKRLPHDKSGVYARWWIPVEDPMQVVISVVYVCSSGYLVVESIRQLFALPPAAFDLPSWGRYWPHFS